MTRLVVRNLSTTSTVESVGHLFSRFGAVRSIDLATDVMTGRCVGFGYVYLAETEAGSAVAALDGLRVDGRALRVSLEQKGGSKARSSSAGVCPAQALISTER